MKTLTMNETQRSMRMKQSTSITIENTVMMFKKQCHHSTVVTLHHILSIDVQLHLIHFVVTVDGDVVVVVDVGRPGGLLK
jgi:hypothetical protein